MVPPEEGGPLLAKASSFCFKDNGVDPFDGASVTEISGGLGEGCALEVGSADNLILLEPDLG